MRKFFKEYIYTKVNTLKENITLLAENDKETFNATVYENKGGNCAVCVVCDILNEYYKDNKYTPKPRTSKNNFAYSEMCDTTFALYYNNDNYDIYNNLKECVESDFKGYVIIACKGGYHAIRVNNHMILNNWSNREYQSYKEFLKEIHYQKAPKLKFYVKDNDIIKFEYKLVNTELMATNYH